MIETTIFTSADRPYEHFVLPFAAGALLHNDGARVEICLEEPRNFISGNQAAIDIFAELFPGRLLLRGAIFEGRSPNLVRFLEAPYQRTPYTYIADIDVLILEEITQQHLAHMRETGLPYSNVIRRDEPNKLTGLHFTVTDRYFPARLPPGHNLATVNDEVLLYEIIAPQGLPDPADTFRPLHGIHFSINRRLNPKNGEPGWGLHHANVASAFMALQSTELWRRLYEHFDLRFQLLYLMAQSTIDTLHLDISARKNARLDFKDKLRDMTFRIGDMLAASRSNS